VGRARESNSPHAYSRDELEVASFPSQGGPPPTAKKASVLVQHVLFGATSRVRDRWQRRRRERSRAPPIQTDRSHLAPSPGARPSRGGPPRPQCPVRGVSQPNVWSYGPPITRMTLFRRHASPARRLKVAGRRQAGAHGGSRSRVSERANTHPRLARSRPTRVLKKRASLAASIRWPPIGGGIAPPIVDEGVALPGVLHRIPGGARKQLEVVAIRRRAGVPRGTTMASEDPRVRECDLINVLCCIAPAVSSDRHRIGSKTSNRRRFGFARRFRAPPRRQRAKAPRAGVVTHCSRGAWRVGLGSTNGSRFLYVNAASGERQGCLRWLEPLSDSAGTRRPFRARAETSEARNGVVKRRPPPPPREAREPHWSGCPIDSRDWADVGRMHLWFESSNLVTKALTRRATRSRTGIARCRSSVRREADRVEERSVANGCTTRESVGSKPLPLESGERASVHRTTRRNASRPCPIAPNPRYRVGARFSQTGLAVRRRKPVHGAGSCRSASDPKRRCLRDRRGT
jgi:hypothetical protein